MLTQLGWGWLGVGMMGGGGGWGSWMPVVCVLLKYHRLFKISAMGSHLNYVQALLERWSLVNTLRSEQLSE